MMYVIAVAWTPSATYAIEGNNKSTKHGQEYGAAKLMSFDATRCTHTH